MDRPLHADAGLTLSGSMRISPRLGPDDVERLRAVASASMEASLDRRSSALVDTLAPGHPEGPNPWVACPDGCCLDIGHDSWVRQEAIEPWLRYLVATMFADRAFDGALMLFDHADRTFTALTVDGTRVRRERVLTRSRGAGRAAGGRSAHTARPIRSV